MEQTDTRDWAVAHLSGAIEDTIVLQYAEDLLDVCSGMERAGEALSEEAQEKREELEELVASIEKRAKTYDPDLLDIAERCVRVCKTRVGERAIASEMVDANGGEIETYVRLVRSVRIMIAMCASPVGKA